MDEYVIITRKEDLKEVIKEVFAELTATRNEPKPQSKYLDMDKLIDFLVDNNCRISKSQIYKLTRLNKIPHRKVGKKLLFNRQEVLDWMHKGNGRA